MNEGRISLTAGQWWAIVLCALAAFFDGYDAQMLAMAIPLMAGDFHVARPSQQLPQARSPEWRWVRCYLVRPTFGRRPC
jgi:hypothetical protein